MEKHKIVVGQKVFFRKLSDRQGDDTSLHPGIVRKVGRKYMEVEGVDTYCNERFDMEDMYARFSMTGHAFAKAYLTEQDYFDEQEYEFRKTAIRNLFAYYSFPKLSLDQIRRIHAILDEPKP